MKKILPLISFLLIITVVSALALVFVVLWINPCVNRDPSDFLCAAATSICACAVKHARGEGLAFFKILLQVEQLLKEKRP